ncbi:SPFH domain-containing protein [Georgenia sp. Z1491]|uniref:SPFH domain-containing protein n=1 Tax=Georgenia sp. Z1491 TaxID=3416707 RepID=UPI003CE8806B
MTEWIILGVIVIAVVVILSKAVVIVPQAGALIVERLGKYHSTMFAGFHVLIPFFDKVRARVDLREQVVSFAPQPVITSDNLVVSIDTVIYFQVTEPGAAVYEIANYITGIEQLTVTTLRNVIGSMDLEQTLTSRDQINSRLRGVLDEATGRWGIRVNRVELKAIDPPQSVQGAMEQQMRAERDRRAAILTAEGVKQSAILTAEGEKQSQILRAEGEAQSAVLRAQGESRAIHEVFQAIHSADADDKVLSYQYLQTLPEIAKTQSNKMWFIPAEVTGAMASLASAFGPEGGSGGGSFRAPTPPRPPRRGDGDSAESGPSTSTPPPSTAFDAPSLQDPQEALREARADVASAESEVSEEPGIGGRRATRSRAAGDAGAPPVGGAAPGGPTTGAPGAPAGGAPTGGPATGGPATGGPAHGQGPAGTTRAWNPGGQPPSRA